MTPAGMNKEQAEGWTAFIVLTARFMEATDCFLRRRNPRAFLRQKVEGLIAEDRRDGLQVQGTPGVDPRQGQSGLEKRPC